MDAGGVTASHRMFACAGGGIVSAPDGTAYAVYDDGGATHLDDIPYTTGTMASPAYSNHRVSLASATWVASAPAPGTVEVHTIPDRGLVATVAGTAFDVVGDELFWDDGGRLHAGRLCLQPK
jgi:non-ribosomal peptide synthetase component F